MIDKTKLSRALIAALLAAAFAGSGLTTVGTALNAQHAIPIWLASSLTALCCALMALSAQTAILGAAGLGLFTGGWALSHMTGLRAIPVFFAAWQGRQANSALVTAGMEALLLCGALMFAALFFLMLYHHGFTGLAIMLLSSMLIFSHGMSQSASIPAAVPGLIAASAAFALSGSAQRDQLFVRVLIPSALAVALALLLSPTNRMTWKPMEDLANRVRDVFEQYFNFTHERIAFSITEEGYNHGGEVDGQTVTMLGGPAYPDQKPVMKVTSQDDLLLRGTIRSTYTGYSWVDVTPKNRYLYYDLTHRAVRDRVFNLNYNAKEGFKSVEGGVELLDSATSTLFVPGRLSRFDMDLANAVYYNSAGEMFMARVAEPGDRYAVAAQSPVFSEALRQAALKGEANGDAQYDSLLAAHTQLPEGIERGLYDLTMEIVAGCDNDYDRAAAIMGYLRRNMRYRLDVEYPPHGRDFASWFVLESKQGYCSYFATAMAVMGRLAGLPTRYVEGYYARANPAGEVTLTGMDAHAWAEVYLKGLGWIPFDATNGGPGGAGNGGSGEGDAQYGYAPDGSQTQETPFEDNSDELDGTNEDGENSLPDVGDDDEDDQDDEQDEQSDEPEDDPEQDETPPDAPDDTEQEKSGIIKWIVALLIILMLILLALFIRHRLLKADPMTLCRQTKRAQDAAMIAYRANLTLLAHMGQQPQSGETPDAFVSRVCGELDNPDYADFVRAVSVSRYGRRPMRREQVEVGLRAYRTFLRGMRPLERVRFTFTRIVKGLGDFERIP